MTLQIINAQFRALGPGWRFEGISAYSANSVILWNTYANVNIRFQAKQNAKPCTII